MAGRFKRARRYLRATPGGPSRNRLIWRRTWVSLAAVVVIIVGYMGTTLAMYLTNPTYGVSLAARAAEWGRDHDLGAVVSWVERIQYDLNPPKIGGRPPQGSFGYGKTKIHVPVGGHLPLPTRVASPAGANLPGEGVWHPLGRETARGIPTMYDAFVRPDPVHTSYVAGLVWMDPTLLTAHLYSGSYIPGGGPYRYSAPVTASASTTLVAAFNAGFRMGDAHGGYYTDGEVIVPLRNGAASVVIYKDGTMTVGQWGRDVAMSPNVVAVRQNLNLLVDNSRAVKGLNANDNTIWGATLGGGAYVWRSGIGVTASGAIVYAAGPTLSITTLANLLVAAGCVRAMELDINPDWVQFSTYHGRNGTVVNGSDGTSLMSSMLGPPSRYFTTWWSRDFFTMSLRAGDLVPPKK